MLHASRRPSHPALVLREGVLTREESTLGSPRVFQRDAFTGNYRLGFKHSYFTWPLILCHKEEKIIIALIPSKSGPEFWFNLLYLN